MSGKITIMPVLADKMTVIHDKLPAIRDALERLTVSTAAIKGHSATSPNFGKNFETPKLL